MCSGPLLRGIRTNISRLSQNLSIITPSKTHLPKASRPFELLVSPIPTFGQCNQGDRQTCFWATEIQKLLNTSEGCWHRSEEVQPTTGRGQPCLALVVSQRSTARCERGAEGGRTASFFAAWSSHVVSQFLARWSFETLLGCLSGLRTQAFVIFRRCSFPKPPTQCKLCLVRCNNDFFNFTYVFSKTDPWNLSENFCPLKSSTPKLVGWIGG